MSNLYFRMINLMTIGMMIKGEREGKRDTRERENHLLGT